VLVSGSAAQSRDTITALVRRLPHLAQRNRRSFSGHVTIDDRLQVRGCLVEARLAPDQQAEPVVLRQHVRAVGKSSVILDHRVLGAAELGRFLDGPTRPVPRPMGR
jgi:hypothetical protein